MKIDNTFNNPIGAVPPLVQSSVDGYSSTPLVDYENVYGRGGSVRHSGSFSPDNPAYQQLLAAQQGGGKNQDIDALYEKAVQWEIDNANTERQHAYEQAMRDEQREYEDPVNQLARQRAAGINPDIVGSGSGVSSGSSAPMSVSPRINTPTQTKFSNAYDNTSFVLDGIGTAASVVSSITGLAGTVMNGIDMFATLPSRVKLGNTTAKVAEMTADGVIAATNAANAVTTATKDANISNAYATTFRNNNALIAELSSNLNQDSTDEQFADVFTLSGIPADQHEVYKRGVKAYLDDPARKAQHDKNVVAQRKAEQERKKFTPELFARVVEHAAQVKEHSARFDEWNAAFQADLAMALYFYETEEGPSSGVLADSMVHGWQAESQVAQERYYKVKRDIQVFGRQLTDIKQAVIKSQELVDEIYAKAESEKRDLSSAELGIIDTETVKQSNLLGLGSYQLNSVYSIARQTAYSRYMADVNMDDDGDIELTPGNPKHFVFGAYQFGQFMSDPDSSSLVSDILGLIPFVGGIATKSTHNQNTPTPKIIINNRP